MKKISIALNIILIAGMVYMGCKTKDPTDPVGNGSTGDSSHCVTCNQTFNGVYAKDFMEVIARYRDTHWKVINSRMSADISTNVVDSRCVWFSMDRLKNFICYIERYSDSLKVNRDSLGIRFYYAVYPGKTHGNFDDDYKSRLGQHTIYMVPTTEVNSEAVDFDPYISLRNRRAGNDTLAYMANLLTGNGNRQLFILAPDSKPVPGITKTGSFAMNNGHLCPVNCPPVAQNTLDNADSEDPSMPY